MKAYSHLRRCCSRTGHVPQIKCSFRCLGRDAYPRGAVVGAVISVALIIRSSKSTVESSQLQPIAEIIGDYCPYSFAPRFCRFRPLRSNDKLIKRRNETRQRLGIAASLFCAAGVSRTHPATVTVTNAHASGPGSLRQSLADARVAHFRSQTAQRAFTGSI